MSFLIFLAQDLHDLLNFNWIFLSLLIFVFIQLLESPIPAAAAPPSQKASSDDISGTKRGTVDLLVSKRPEKNSE